MIASRQELKARAKESLKGKWGEGVLTTLIYTLIPSGIAFVSTFVIIFLLTVVLLSQGLGEETVTGLTNGVSNVISIIIGIFIAPLTVGFVGFYLKLARNQETKLTELFEGYKKSFGNSIGAYILSMLYIFLWSLLFVIPGLMKSYSYSMMYFIIADEPDILASKALEKSKEMMQGHRWELFVLHLSFLGWTLLAGCTCYIGMLWLTPYMQTTMSNFYMNVKAEYEAKTMGQSIYNA